MFMGSGNFIFLPGAAGELKSYLETVKESAIKDAADVPLDIFVKLIDDMFKAVPMFQGDMNDVLVMKIKREISASDAT